MVGETKITAAGTLKEGNYICIDGVACKIVDINFSKPGKHGSRKANIFATGLLDDKKRNLVLPASDNVDVPVIGKKNAQVLSVNGNQVNVMDSESYETFDLTIPSDLEGQITEGMTVVYWEILNDKVIKQIKNE